MNNMRHIFGWFRGGDYSEQSFYKDHYRSYIIGLLFSHERFYIGRYLYHLRGTEYFKTKSDILSHICLAYHYARMNYYSRKTGLQFGVGMVELGVRIYHSGWIIINAAKVGKNLAIYPGVTIGQSGGSSENVPTIGNNVWIYQNAMVCGKITVGDNVTILANSVVTHDVPSNCIVGGIPAKIIRYLDES